MVDGGGKLREVRLEVLGGRETGACGGARPGDGEEGAWDEGRVGAGGVDDAVEEAGRRVGEGGGEDSGEQPVDEHDKTCCPHPRLQRIAARQPGMPAAASLAATRDEASSLGLA